MLVKTFLSFATLCAISVLAHPSAGSDSYDLFNREADFDDGFSDYVDVLRRREAEAEAEAEPEEDDDLLHLGYHRRHLRLRDLYGDDNTLYARDPAAAAGHDDFLATATTLAKRNGVGQAVAKARMAKGLSQKDLAQRTNMRVTEITEIESGKVKPSAIQLGKLEKALGVKLR